ncbi:MAG: DUF4382 domain-containing protein [Bacteroidales bacterium]|jgi:hypothetical protein|nr:DUF4382 domain-containing protein [Bacteroidales bacterium]
MIRCGVGVLKGLEGYFAALGLRGNSGLQMYLRMKGRASRFQRVNDVSLIHYYITLTVIKVFTFVQLWKFIHNIKYIEMKKINILLSFIVFIILGLGVSSCEKDATTSNYPYNIRMTDAPGPYDAVFIDLQGIEITGNNGSEVLVNVNTGIYNLLDFANGADTLISSGTLDDATVQQIRLILGSNNSLVIDGVSYPLSTPSAEQSGLKLQVHKTLQAGVQYNVLLDFDANESIVDNGNGDYSLKPVIRTIEVATSGSIKGKITPIGTSASVTATSDTSYSSNVNADGNFMIMGLPEGIYSFTVTPALPLIPVTQDNIEVTTGVTTNLGIIAL